MDIDRLFPGTKFSTGDDGDSGTTDTPVDYVDLGASQTKVVNSAAGLFGFSTEAGTAVNKEGATTLGFGIDFSNSGTINTGTSVNTGAYLSSAGGVTVKSVDIKFGITANPQLTGTQTQAGLANYPG